MVFALLTAILPLDFGPMKKAERRADTTGQLDDPAAPPTRTPAAAAASHNVKPRAKNMLLPMLVMIVTILAVLIISGNGNPTQGDGMQALLWGCRSPCW